MENDNIRDRWRAWRASVGEGWRSAFGQFLVLIPVMICFIISAAIEIIVFRSILTVLGFAAVAVFLALSLELFKLLIPLLLVRDGSAGAGLQNGIVIALRFVLFFISFSCTFIAISNNLVDTNAQQVLEQKQAISAQVTADFQTEYKTRLAEINRMADKKIEDKRVSYNIESKVAQLDRLSETYASNHDWSTYGLIVEMNNALSEAQDALSADLDLIEQERAQQTQVLDNQYADAKLQQKIDDAVTAAQSGGKYDLSQNTNITKLLYLIESTMGIQPSYEWVVLLIAVLICFASECIIWTGSVYLLRGVDKGKEPSDKTAFQKELERRISEKKTDASSVSSDMSSIPSIALFDKRLMKKLARFEQKNIDRRLNLIMEEERKNYRQRMRELRQEQRKNRFKRKKRKKDGFQTGEPAFEQNAEQSAGL